MVGIFPGRFFHLFFSSAIDHWHDAPAILARRQALSRQPTFLTLPDPSHRNRLSRNVVGPTRLSPASRFLGLLLSTTGCRPFGRPRPIAFPACRVATRAKFAKRDVSSQRSPGSNYGSPTDPNPLCDFACVRVLG